MNLEVLKIASNIDNQKILNRYTHHSKHKNPICGDEMQISLNIKKGKIIDFGYQSNSCIYCQASISLLSRKSINQKISNIKKLLDVAENFYKKEKSSFPKKWYFFNKIFNKKNISRKECLLLPFKTLAKALDS